MEDQVDVEGMMLFSSYSATCSLFKDPVPKNLQNCYSHVNKH